MGICSSSLPDSAEEWARKLLLSRLAPEVGTNDHFISCYSAKEQKTIQWGILVCNLSSSGRCNFYLATLTKSQVFPYDLKSRWSGNELILSCNDQTRVFKLELEVRSDGSIGGELMMRDEESFGLPFAVLLHRCDSSQQ